MAEKSDNRLRVSPSNLLFDDGVYSSISANKHNDVFIVYHSNAASSDIRYQAGKFTKLDELNLQHGAKMKHFEGSYPQAAINDDKIVVVVFSSSNTIKYTIGFVHDKKKKILWELPEKVPSCTGEYPSIAISGKKVLLVFSSNKKIYYITGLLSDSSREIDWGQEKQVLDSNACYPKVAMTESAFVVLYQDDSTSRLKTVVGEIQQDSNDPTYKLICGEAQNNADNTGQYPSVTMFDDCSIVATYENGTGPFRMVYACSGKVKLAEKTLEWHRDTARDIIHGTLSTVAAVNKDTEKAFIEVHCTNKPLACTLYYETGRIMDQ